MGSKHRYRSLLFQAAFRILRNTQDAEDSLQDAFVSAYCNLERFEGRSQFSTWLTRIVINAALIEGYSTGQTASKLGVAENALKARVWRARLRLAERLRHPLEGMVAP